MFPYPKWPQNHHFWGGISALCCAKNIIFRRLSGTWPTLEALFSITSVLACILIQIFIFSALILPLFLGTSVDRHFYLRLHSGSSFHISTLGFVTPLEKLCLMSFASRMYFWLSFHISALDFVTTLEQLHMMSFASRMHFWFSVHISALDFVTPLGKLRLMSFASRMHFGFNIYVFAIDFVIITEKCSLSWCEA